MSERVSELKKWVFEGRGPLARSGQTIGLPSSSVHATCLVEAAAVTVLGWRRHGRRCLEVGEAEKELLAFGGYFVALIEEVEGVPSPHASANAAMSTHVVAALQEEQDAILR